MDGHIGCWRVQTFDTMVSLTTPQKPLEENKHHEGLLTGIPLEPGGPAGPLGPGSPCKESICVLKNISLAVCLFHKSNVLYVCKNEYK